MLKSTQTNKYSTACFIQESPLSSGLQPGKAVAKKSVEGHYYCVFPAVLSTFECFNRMHRRYGEANYRNAIVTDPRIIDLKAKNKWRGEMNHPNAPIEGDKYNSIRMSIPEPMNSSHFISDDKFEDHKYKAMITSHPKTDCGQVLTSEILDLKAVPCFSVRLIGNMIPNALPTQPNVDVKKIITFDCVDFPSHEGADGDISNMVMESQVVFLHELAKYCCEKDEKLQVICESFEILPDEIFGINEGNIIITPTDKSRYSIPMTGDIRREALSILMERGR